MALENKTSSAGWGSRGVALDWVEIPTACLVDRYFSELLELAAADVDLVEAGCILDDFLPHIIEMGSQRWAQLELDRIHRASNVSL